MTKCHILVGRELPFCFSKTSESEMPLNKKRTLKVVLLKMVGVKLQCSNFTISIKNYLDELEKPENVLLFKQLETFTENLKVA